MGQLIRLDSEGNSENFWSGQMTIEKLEFYRYRLTPKNVGMYSVHPVKCRCIAAFKRQFSLGLQTINLLSS